MFEHLRNPYNFLVEMKRLLKPNGIIELITDNGGFILLHYNKRNIVHGDYNYNRKKVDKTDMHYMFFQPEHLRNFFDKLGGFEIKKCGLEKFVPAKNEKLKLKIRFVRGVLNAFLGERLAYQSIHFIAKKNQNMKGGKI